MRARAQRASRAGSESVCDTIHATARLGAPSPFLRASRTTTRRASTARVAAAALALFMLGACQHAATPQHVAGAYANALEREDAEAARQLFSDQLRDDRTDARLDTEFQRRVLAGDQLQGNLQRASDERASLSAELRVSTLEQVDLQLVDGEWVIVDGVLSPNTFGTPRDALTGLVRALDTQDADLLRQLMPAEFRAETSIEALDAWLVAEAQSIADTAELLRLHANEPISIAGERAALRYGSRMLVLRKEGDRWVVWDFD